MKRPVAKISNHSRRLATFASDVIDHSRRSPTFASRCFASSLNAPLELRPASWYKIFFGQGYVAFFGLLLIWLCVESNASCTVSLLQTSLQDKTYLKSLLENFFKKCLKDCIFKLHLTKAKLIFGLIVALNGGL